MVEDSFPDFMQELGTSLRIFLKKGFGPTVLHPISKLMQIVPLISPAALPLFPFLSFPTPEMAMGVDG